MHKTIDLLQSVRQSERDKLDKLSRFLTPVRIYSTEEYVGSKHVKQEITEKKFKPNIFFKLFALMFITGLLASTFTGTFFKSDITIPGRVFIYLLVGFLLIGAIKQFFFDKSVNYNILIDKSGIRVNDQPYLWSDILETGILTLGAGLNPSKYLILLLKNKTYEKFDLTHFIDLNFWGCSSTLSKYIEYFKPGVKW